MEQTLTETILSFLHGAHKPLPREFALGLEHVRRHHKNISYKQYYNAIRRLEQRGAIRISRQGSDKVISLTEDGALEMLFEKAFITRPKKWDGKWRMVIFDIPETARDRRNAVRVLLRKHGFQKLQASVFVSPWEMNAAAIDYLEKTGLKHYIRIARIERFDNDSDLRKRFRLS